MKLLKEEFLFGVYTGFKLKKEWNQPNKLVGRNTLQKGNVKMTTHENIAMRLKTG